MPPTESQQSLYTYTSHMDEIELCQMELRALFGGVPSQGPAFLTEKAISVSRSPFTKERIQILHQAESLEELARQVDGYTPEGPTFKVKYIKAGEDVPFDQRRDIERQIGLHIRGKAEMRRPDTLLGVARYGGRWWFGRLEENEAVWLKHNDKAQNYSTALPTRMARAVANILVPQPSAHVRAIDPACGIGTVVLEALSMGIAIEGCDLNWMAVRGARSNLQHFGYPDVVKVADMRTLQGRYAAAVLDLPYNLCSKLEQAERQEMLDALYRLAPRVVIISTESVEAVIRQAGYTITDYCTASKGNFKRMVWLGEVEE